MFLLTPPTPAEQRIVIVHVVALVSSRFFTWGITGLASAGLYSDFIDNPVTVPDENELYVSHKWLEVLNPNKASGSSSKAYRPYSYL